MLKKAFAALETLLYLGFILLDLRYQDSAWVKYSGILLCFAASLILWILNRDRDHGILLPAMALTVLADWFLLVCDSHYALGVGCFCLVQTVYALRLGITKGLPLRLGLLTGLVVFALSMKLELDAAGWFSLYSITFLLCNFIISFSSKSLFFTLGLGLFLGCDLCVGLYNLSSYLPIPVFLKGFIALCGDLMWIFYLPSQVCIVLSGGDLNEGK